MLLSIHVGLPKCGSTTIQHVLGGMREELARRGIHYPASFRPNFEAANTLINNQWSAGNIGVDDIVAEAREANARHCLISSEFITINMQAFAPETLVGARKWLSDNDVTLHLIQVSRSRDRFMESIYRQSITNGAGHSSTYYDMDLSVYEQAHSSGMRMLSKYLQPEGVFRYQLEDQNWLGAMFGDLGVSLPKTVPRTNRSAPDVAIEALRQFCAMGDAAPSRVFFVRLLQLAVGRANSSLWRQACSRPMHDARVLTEEFIAALSFTPNPPLSYTESEFNAFKDQLARLLAAHRRAIHGAPRRFVNVFEDMHPV
ncbi:hypothetical protein [Henriciella litoralis]|uniref:hypothetical protein n=1 Tax=Henriciella litoralis TaxID=568102 RepID=UPI000A0212E1|nr:hypothetical protein [Henriciella litoralis]